MWIRSQDKSVLIDTKNVYITEDFSGDWYKVKTVLTESDNALLGKYKRESTALEVVDMIQLRIVQSYLRKRHKSTRCLANAEDVVFEMPKDVPANATEKN